MFRFLSFHILGTALAVGRFYQAQFEVAKIRKVDDELKEHHLLHLSAFTNRINMIKSFPKEAVVAEIGVAAGDFASVILRESLPRKLYLIDTWRGGRNASGHAITLEKKSKQGRSISDFERVRGRFATEIEDQKIEMLQGQSVTMISALPNQSLDWVYLDAAHDFDSVCADLEALLPKMRSNGIIAGHDYVRWGRFGYRGGVIEAVHSFCKTHDFELFALTFDSHYPPSYAIRPINGTVR